MFRWRKTTPREKKKVETTKKMITSARLWAQEPSRVFVSSTAKNKRLCDTQMPPAATTIVVTLSSTPSSTASPTSSPNASSSSSPDVGLIVGSILAGVVAAVLFARRRGDGDTSSRGVLLSSKRDMDRRGHSGGGNGEGDGDFSEGSYPLLRSLSRTIHRQSGYSERSSNQPHPPHYGHHSQQQFSPSTGSPPSPLHLHSTAPPSIYYNYIDIEFSDLEPMMMQEVPGSGPVLVSGGSGSGSPSRPVLSPLVIPSNPQSPSQSQVESQPTTSTAVIAVAGTSGDPPPPPCSPHTDDDSDSDNDTFLNSGQSSPSLYSQMSASTAQFHGFWGGKWDDTIPIPPVPRVPAIYERDVPSIPEVMSARSRSRDLQSSEYSDKYHWEAEEEEEDQDRDREGRGGGRGEGPSLLRVNTEVVGRLLKARARRARAERGSKPKRSTSSTLVRGGGGGSSLSLSRSGSRVSHLERVGSIRSVSNSMFSHEEEEEEEREDGEEEKEMNGNGNGNHNRDQSPLLAIRNRSPSLTIRNPFSRHTTGVAFSLPSSGSGMGSGAGAGAKSGRGSGPGSKFDSSPSGGSAESGSGSSSRSTSVTTNTTMDTASSVTTSIGNYPAHAVDFTAGRHVLPPLPPIPSLLPPHQPQQHQPPHPPIPSIPSHHQHRRRQSRLGVIDDNGHGYKVTEEAGTRDHSATAPAPASTSAAIAVASLDCYYHFTALPISHVGL
ncbi:hypothetical protein D9757_014490 [Collybiopsis confluens]|uniref:Uncharacterized protein n=1 Tax=Collybiopsis confluens TaxID=2823264 RepID=A0A8H5CN98_9AGAR|nr:hypothetical protein D9757_014490 [Collybiopsis confluens]